MRHAAIIVLFIQLCWVKTSGGLHAKSDELLQLQRAAADQAASGFLRQWNSREDAGEPMAGKVHGGRMLQRKKPYFHTHRYRDGRRPGKPNGYYVNMTSSNTVVLPASLTAKRPPCKQLQFDNAGQGKWYRDDAGHWAYELDHCKLWRSLGDAAGKCLGGKRIVMLGDSVSRYQYTTLLHFLVTKQYQHPYDDAQASVSNKYQWKSWDGYYAGAAHLITRLSNQHGKATCDCQHGEGHLPFEVWRLRFNTSLHNYSPRKPPSKKPVSRGLLQNVGQPTQLDDAAQHMSEQPAQDVQGTARKLEKSSKSKSDRGRVQSPLDPTQVLLDFFYVYKYPNFLTAGLEGIAWAFNVEPPFPIPQRKSMHQPPAAAPTPPSASATSSGASYWGMRHWRPPDIIILNMGIFWWSKEGETLEEVMTQIFKYARKLAAKYGTRLIWKTTTVEEWDQEPHHMNRVVADLAKEHGFEVYDVRAIAAAAEAQRLEIKWDNTSVHFLPVAYEQFNDLLLNTICNRQLFEPGT